jgi:hypothetical protein
MMDKSKRRGVTIRQIVLAIVAAVAAVVITLNLLEKSPHERLNAEYESKFADLQARVQKCLDNCPATSAGEDRAIAEPLSPPLDANNTIVVSIEAAAKARGTTDDKALQQLVPDKRLHGDDSDLVYRWRSTDIGQSAFMEIGMGMLPAFYADLLDARYVVAVRLVDWTPPHRDDNIKNYIQLVAGAAKVTVYVCDLQTGELLGSTTQEIIQDRGLVSSEGDPVETATDQLAELVGNSVRASAGKLAGSQLDENPLRDIESRMTGPP